MNYEIAFWVLLAIIVVKSICTIKIYIGPDREKYEKATLGILLKRLI